MSDLPFINRLTPTRLLFVILLVKLLVGMLYITQQPLWQYHEADFLRVVRYLRDEGQLPVLAADAQPDTSNTSQPPLYYLLLYPFVRVLDDHQAAPPGQHAVAICEGYNANLTDLVTTTADNQPLRGVVFTGYAMRTFSLMMAMVAMVFTYLTGRLLFPQRPALALVATALVAFEPTLVALASEINNDNLILMLGAIHLWLCARVISGRGSPAVNVLLLFVVGVLAVLSKLTGWLLLGISIAILLGLVLRTLRRVSSPRQVRLTLIGMGLVLVVIAGLMLFNYSQYGSVFGRYRQLETAISRTLSTLSPRNALDMTVATVQDTLNYYQGPFAQFNPRAVFVSLYRFILLAGLLAAGWAIIRAWRARPRAEIPGFVLLAMYWLLVFGLVIFRSIITNSNPDFVNTMVIFAPVRYYGPALPALALLFSAGFMALLPRQLQPALNPIGAGVAGVWLLVSLSVLSIPMSANQLRGQSVLTAEAFASVVGLESAPPSSPGEPELLGYAFEPQPENGIISLTLYARAAEPLSTNYMVDVDVRDSSGGLSQRCGFMPVRGLYPTPRWETGDVVKIQAAIPNCLPPASLPLSVGFRWLPLRTDGSIDTTAARPDMITLGTVDTVFSQANCPPNLGIIGGGLQILKSDTPTRTTPGTFFALSVNWLARSIPLNASIRFYVLTHEASGSEYVCSGAPRQWTYPFGVWSVGETIYFDECVFSFPADAPDGTYRIGVGVQDGDGAWLEADDPNGDPLPDHLVPIGEITLERS